MVVTPNSRIRLLKSPIELDEKNQLTFSSEQNQRNYFLSLPYLEYDNCSYQRKEGVIRYQTEPNGITFEDLIKYNYCMYQNTYYDNKWFYAFITDVKYINDGMTEIKIETDVMQTWKFDIVYKKSFVEREHVNNDTIGLHTLPENLELGDYIDQTVSSTEQTSFNAYTSNSRPLVVVSVTQTGIAAIDTGTGREYNGIYSGLINIAFPNPSSAETFILYLDSKFSESPVVAVFMSPWEMANPNLASWDTYSEGSFSFLYKEVPYSTSPTLITAPSLSKINYLDSSYYPKNNKLLTYPYIYFLIDNNVGGCFDFKYEMFSDSACNFQIYGTLGIGCSIKLRPTNYNKKSGGNYLFGVDAPKLPTCAWVNDAYTNWLTGNAVNLQYSIATDIVKVGIGAATENPIIMGNSALSIGSTLSEIYQRSKMPLQAHNGANQGDFTYSNLMSFTVYRKSIKQEYASIIDDYFSAYGYKVNSWKVPNLDGRTNWNYVKTIGINLTGDIPQADLQKIKDIYDNGVTLWHNPSTFLDYSQSNGIVS